MQFRQIIIPITIILLCSIALYYLIAIPPAPDPAPSHNAAQIESVTLANTAVDGQVNISVSTQSTSTPTFDSATQIRSGRKRIHVYGHIVDDDLRPIADAVVAEERYFAQARSDAKGYYRLSMELPRHRYPTLHFLRSSYAGQRVKLDANQFASSLEYELNIELRSALESVTLEGRVTDEIGLGLEGARIELSAIYSSERDNYYLTTFSDENGAFSFEGAESGKTYKLSVNQSPDYSYYENPDFVLVHNPAPLNIALQSLKFVDLEGMVVNRAGEPIANYEIYVTNLSTGIHTQKLVSDSSGFFTLKRFPLGEIALATRGPEQYQISGMQVAEDAYQSVEIIVDRGSQYLSGWVSDENGVAVARAMVTIDRKFELNAVEYSSYRSQSTGNDGKFAFDSLGRGVHHVKIYSWGYEKQAFDIRLDGQASELFVALKPIR